MPEKAQPEKSAGEGARAEPARAQPAAASPRPAPTVTVYSTSWCPYCGQTREYFRRKRIAVVEHDIERDAGARARKRALTGNDAVPTVVIGGVVIQGFRPAEFEKALAR